MWIFFILLKLFQRFLWWNFLKNGHVTLWLNPCLVHVLFGDLVNPYPLVQACTTYGPRARCGPRKSLIVFVRLVSLMKTPFECVKNINFGLLFCPKKICTAMRYDMCTLVLKCHVLFEWPLVDFKSWIKLFNAFVKREVSFPLQKNQLSATKKQRSR